MREPGVGSRELTSVDAGSAQLALHRADVDDLAATAPDHPPSDGLAYDEDAAQVRRDEAIPGVVGKLGERPAMLHAGVVDQDVDAADPSLDAGDGRFDGGLVGDVEGLGIDAVTFGGKCRARGLERGGIAGIEHDARASAGQSAGQGQADALARPGDQRGPAVEREQGGKGHDGLLGR